MFWTVVITGILAAVVQHGVRYCLFMDYHKNIPAYRHSPGPCHQLQGAGNVFSASWKQYECLRVPTGPSCSKEGGSEDITILPDGLAFISSGLYPSYRGRILLFNFNDPTQNVLELNIIGENFNKSDFHPHGLSFWINKDTGKVTLAVVNHAAAEDHVEIFRFEKDTKSLLHVRSITHPLFTSMNDLALASESTFYITKFSALRENVWLEYRMLLNYGELLYYDGGDVKRLVGGLKMSNGVNFSPDRKYLYLSASQEIRSYRILENNDLEQVENLNLGTCLDNIEVDIETGDIWIGAIPVLHLSLEHDALNGVSSIEIPSQVIKISTSEGQFKDAVQVYLDSGKEMSGLSVASVYKGHMIGGTLTSQMILCDVVYIN